MELLLSTKQCCDQNAEHEYEVFARLTNVDATAKPFIHHFKVKTEPEQLHPKAAAELIAIQRVIIHSGLITGTTLRDIKLTVSAGQTRKALLQKSHPRTNELATPILMRVENIVIGVKHTTVTPEPLKTTFIQQSTLYSNSLFSTMTSFGTLAISDTAVKGYGQGITLGRACRLLIRELQGHVRPLARSCWQTNNELNVFVLNTKGDTLIDCIPTVNWKKEWKNDEEITA